MRNRVVVLQYVKINGVIHVVQTTHTYANAHTQTVMASDSQ